MVRFINSGNCLKLLQLSGPIEANLPTPQPFERRDDEVEVAVDPVVAHLAHLAHLDGEGDPVQQFDGGLVFTVLFIGIALAADRDEVHRGNVHDDRGLGREIVLPVFFLEIECHN